MDYTRLALFVAVGVLTGVLADYDAFREAAKADPDTRFDWGKSLRRAFIGVLAGVAAFFGVANA